MASFGLSRQSIQLHLDETFERLEELDDGYVFCG